MRARTAPQQAGDQHTAGAGGEKEAPHLARRVSGAGDDVVLEREHEDHAPVRRLRQRGKEQQQQERLRAAEVHSGCASAAARTSPLAACTSWRAP